ncbi:hypothetical protein SAMN02745121_05615 [Nannocystis exedens]|uniref:Uncharacterized protein n=1 Tax=Nannocystis exedens TaxID=54 RepID=A0A1I2DMV5_9BACT|nr:hypothetical protein [Nannocystis exedens]PCC69052.1 hypothetical protein NAEX_02074 [Nannocystis exedens]SFE81661.1 hypothetical protein SAMN02745121_05615 [Nannocystis exedens]
MLRRILGEALATDEAVEGLLPPDADFTAKDKDKPINALHRTYSVACGLKTKALVEWIATGERQPRWFERAFRIYSRDFARQYAKKKPSLQHGVYPLVQLACAAERAAEASEILMRVLPDKKFVPAKARRIAELALSMAADPRPLRDRAERFLRANVRERIDHGGYGDVAEYTSTSQALPVSRAHRRSSSRARRASLARERSAGGRGQAGSESMSSSTGLDAHGASSMPFRTCPLSRCTRRTAR